MVILLCDLKGYSCWNILPFWNMFSLPFPFVMSLCTWWAMMHQLTPFFAQVHETSKEPYTFFPHQQGFDSYTNLIVVKFKRRQLQNLMTKSKQFCFFGKCNCRSPFNKTSAIITQFFSDFYVNTFQKFQNKLLLLNSSKRKISSNQFTDSEWTSTFIHRRCPLLV